MEFNVQDGLHYLNLAHMRAHELPSDPDDTILIALTRQEYLLLGIGLPLLGLVFPCLQAEQVALEQRLVELRQAQKPEWGPESGE